MAKLDVVLPITRSVQGVWEQRAQYAQADLHEEVVLDVEGPLSSAASAGTEVVRIVIVGDRNAGKSTLLHALVNFHDRDWLRVTSLLPVVAGSFVNRRFGDAGPCVPGSAPRDELPYLDTDVARSTVVLTREDFRFFVAEFGLDVAVGSSDYVALELVELGGDHLEAMMDEGTRPRLLKASLEHSKQVVQRATHLAYFANCAKLAPDGLVDEEEWASVVRRLRWLTTQADALDGVTVFASRLPPVPLVNDEPLARDDDHELAAVQAALARDDAGVPLTRALHARLLSAGLDVVDVRPARHVKPSHAMASAVDVPGLIAVLVALFRRKLATHTPGVDLVAAHLFTTAAKAATTVVDDLYAPWIDRDRFSTELDDDDCDDSHRSCCGGASPLRVPAHLCAHFSDVATALCRRGVLVGRRRGTRDFEVRCQGRVLRPENVDDLGDPTLSCSVPDVLFAPGTTPRPADDLCVRAPMFPPLRKFIANAFAHNLLALDETLSTALLADVDALEPQLDAALTSAFRGLAQGTHAARRLLWLAEDRFLLHTLRAANDNEATANAQPKRPRRLSSPLHVALDLPPSLNVQAALDAFHDASDGSEEATAVLQLNVMLQDT